MTLEPLSRCIGAGTLLAAGISLLSCSQQPVPNLAAQLKGIDQSRFLGCSGPPFLQYPQGGSQVEMSFVTNLKRGQAIGIASPTAFAPEDCSVDAIFTDQRLVQAKFSGNLSMCDLVFSPCLSK